VAEEYQENLELARLEGPTLHAITFIIWYLKTGDTYTDTGIRKDQIMTNREVTPRESKPRTECGIAAFWCQPMAERAKLDDDNFWLHKFRATFATRCLWAGVDLRTVLQWLGHSDMESTMRYLKPSRRQHVREKVNEIFA
jgi:site-specific recombinase XerD